MSALARFTSFSPPPTAGAVRHLARRRGLRLLLRSVAMILAAAGLTAGSLALAAGLMTGARGPTGPAQATAAAAEWTDIVHPMALYDLAGTEFSKLPPTYRARRRREDAAREDVLTFGVLGLAKPYLQLSLLRVGAEPDAGSDGLTDGLARLASARGLTATRIRAGAPVDTRLGRIEAADLLLWDGDRATPCLGFLTAANGDSVLRLSGFACGAPGRPVGRAALACAIDRIDLLAAGEDAALRAVFVAAERRDGSSCIGATAPTSAGSLLPTSRHLGWLDPDGQMPPLRGLFEVTPRQR